MSLVSCGTGGDPNKTTLSLIGPSLQSANPDTGPLTDSEALIAQETAQGLVALDAFGQIEPALAESWIVTDDGLSIIFRLRRTIWPDGSEVTGDDVAASLNKAMASNSRNTLKPYMSAIRDIIGMTGRVVEIRLRAPRPNLLQLLAQPELGIRRRGFGSGPWRIARQSGARMILRPVPDAMTAPDTTSSRDERQVTLIKDRAAVAIARFQEDQTDAVLGGTVTDWPLVGVANLDENDIRIDPAEGLFGLAILPRAKALQNQSIREAMSMAIDRVELVRIFGAQRWKATDKLLPAQFDSGAPPASPAWSNNSPDERVMIARGRVERWVAANGPIPVLHLALPHGPGSKLLLASLQRDLRAIGMQISATHEDASNADIRLIDAIAPNNSANWYLTRTGCDAGFICSEAGHAALLESRMAPTLAIRSAALARADKLHAETYGFITLAKPLRWSLVKRYLTGFRDNAFSVHPVDQLKLAAQD